MLRTILRRSFTSSAKSPKLASRITQTSASHSRVRAHFSSTQKSPVVKTETTANFFDFLVKLRCIAKSKISPNSTALSFITYTSDEKLRQAIKTHSALMIIVDTLKLPTLSSRRILTLLVSKLGRDHLETLFSNKEEELIRFISSLNQDTLWHKPTVSHNPILVSEIKAEAKKADAEEADAREDNSKKNALTINNVGELKELLKFYIANNNRTSFMTNALKSYKPKTIDELLQILAINYQGAIRLTEILAHQNGDTLRKQINDAQTLIRVLETLNYEVHYIVNSLAGTTGLDAETRNSLFNDFLNDSQKLDARIKSQKLKPEIRYTLRETDSAAKLKLLDILGLKHFTALLNKASKEERKTLLDLCPPSFAEACREVFFQKTTAHEIYATATQPGTFELSHIRGIFAAPFKFREPETEQPGSKPSYLSP